MVSSPRIENISVEPSAKSILGLPPSCPTKGASAVVANAGQGAVDARVRKTSAVLRTVKSFGSDAPVLASTRDEANASHGDGGKKAGHQYEIV